METISSSLELNKDSKIAVLYGGMSSEREVSLRSGKNCYDALVRLGYKNVELIDVDKNIANNIIEKGIEVAYIALHGKYGEDGCIQGLLEILGIPYTGCGVKASAIAMDKDFTKRILKTQNIPVLDSTMIYDIKDLDEKAFEYPLMIKPVCEGSSIGMAKVNTPEELRPAVETALAFKTGVMLEKYITGKSITVGVLDRNDETFATPILEFRTKTEWYDFEAKYTHGMTEFILPANISDSLTKEIQQLSVKSHKAIEGKGMSRVDFIIDEQNRAFVLEINTIPGMTDLSDLPAQSKAMGISYDELVEIILHSSLMKK